MTRITSRKSEFNASVTLFDAVNESQSSSYPTSAELVNPGVKQEEVALKAEVHTDPLQEKLPNLETIPLRRSTRISTTRTFPAKRAIVKTEQSDDEDDVLTPLSSEEEKDTKNISRPRKRAKLEPSNGSSPTKRATKSSASPTKKSVLKPLTTPHPAPVEWQKTYDAIRKMREGFEAPVDTMGCDMAHRKAGDPDLKNQRFTTLISLMLSSQTKDEVCDAAVTKLRMAVGGRLSLDAIISANESTISNAINKVGFWSKKTVYIKKAAQMLRDKFDSDVPKTVSELCELPGVGPKMATLTLHSAWNLAAGIGVDVHVDRITNRLGWHNPSTLNKPEKTRVNLESWLPKDHWREINHMLVGFGQVICLPQKPRCDLCDLAKESTDAPLCPSRQVVNNIEKRKAVVMRVASKVKEDSSASTDTPKVEIAYEDYRQ